MHNGWEQVAALRRAIDQSADHHRLLLVVGFDGVLVDYQSNRDAVRLSPSVRDLLVALRDRRDTTLAIISGRRVDDIRARAALGPAVFYIGVHGFELQGPGVTAGIPRELDRYRPRIHEIAGAFDDSATPLGIHVEDKEAVVAVHTREAGPVDAVWARLHALNAAADLVNTAALRVYRGNHVLELVPNVGAPRAGAINAVRAFLERRDGTPVFTAYIAEDVRDDEAFGGIEGPGATAAVGSRAPRAEFHLRSTGDVHALLAGLAGRQLDAGAGCL